MNKILVPTDFSENAIKAAVVAAEIAKRSNARVYFLHAMSLGHENIHEPFPLHDRYNTAVLQNRKQEMEIFLQAVSSHYKGLDTEVELDAANVKEAVIEFSKKNDIDLVVMGTKGAGNVLEKLVGSVTGAVVSSSKIPVLVVPEAYGFEIPDGILFACKHFEEDGLLLKMIIELAKYFAATVHVFVFLDSDKMDHTDPGNYTLKLQKYLSFLSGKYTGIDFKGEVIVGNDFENAVESYHLLHNTDMAAMITYPKGLWEKLMLKSVTKKMVFHSRMPVLAIPCTT